MKAGWDGDAPKRPRREVGSTRGVSLDGEWRQMTHKTTKDYIYDWEHFFIERARNNDRFPSGGVYQTSPFQGLGIKVNYKKGDTIALLRFHLFEMHEGTKTQVLAYTGSYIMDTRRRTAQTRIACALNNFVAHSHYNAFGYGHPSATDGFGSLNTMPDEADDCLWNPIIAQEVNKYKTCLLGTKKKTCLLYTSPSPRDRG